MQVSVWQVSSSGRMLMQSMHWEIIGQLVLALCKSKRSLMSREILVRLLLSNSVELFSKEFVRRVVDGGDIDTPGQLVAFIR